MGIERLPSTAGVDLGRLEDASLADLEAMRLLLEGGSVIDWRRLSFRDRQEVDRFLAVNEFDLSRPQDAERLEELRAEAVEYLTRNFSYRIPDEVAHAISVPELLLLASSNGRRQLYACIVLKAMHVMHHLAGRELLFKLPVSDDEVFGFVEAKVVKVVEELRASGYPIVEFAWSRKEHDAVVTKLLAKKGSLAAQVYDKLRFRLITRSVEDLAPMLQELERWLVPFNYVIPGESLNGILPFRQLVGSTPAYARHAEQLQLPITTRDQASGVPNEFSGPSYRVINFVVDLPIRVDEFLCRIADPNGVERGSIIFVLTEFQVMDAETARNNDHGENSHQAYKARQHERVKARLSGGQANSPADDDDDD